jgi:hypothetical protein
MNTTARDQAVIDRVEADLLSGRYFTLKATSNRSVPLGRGPIASRDWANIMRAIAVYAAGGDRSAATASKLFGRINLYLTPNEVVAQVAEVLAEVVREGYWDVVAATGPDAGRPSQHQHATDLHEALRLALLMTEVELNAGWIGHAPGIGWCVDALMKREGVTALAHVYPKVAAKIAANG